MQTFLQNTPEGNMISIISSITGNCRFLADYMLTFIFPCHKHCLSLLQSTFIFILHSLISVGSVHGISPGLESKSSGKTSRRGSPVVGVTSSLACSSFVQLLISSHIMSSGSGTAGKKSSFGHMEVKISLA